MKKQLQKDKRIRKFFYQQELDWIIFKSIVKNENLSLMTKWNAFSKLSKSSVNYNQIRFVNRCILTSHKAKFTRTLKISRLRFLYLARAGKISGLVK